METAAQIDAVTQAVVRLDGGSKRQLIAIAGPPASGKSTLAAGVQSYLTELGIPCGFVPMDGFHLGNAELEQRDLLERKGAPNTFDVVAFKTRLEQVLCYDDVSVPHFDRGNDCVVENAGRITKDQRHIVVEGNYLFLSSGLWSDLAPLWSCKVFLNPPIEVLERRLIARWLDNGLSQEHAVARALKNDIPNAVLTLNESVLHTVDLVLE
ncbi:MAG: hypothetical protein HRU30_06660 [Rhodobacteraceae bacterium]|nr:hypothetical protein [Paracoccaceae bacterium]